MNTRIFADGADFDEIMRFSQDPRIQGFTTNPTLMRAAGIANYEKFAKELLEEITSCPVSLEVFADDEAEMRRQATTIASWAENAYVKVPVTNTHGASTAALIRELSREGIKLNVTALMTPAQVEQTSEALSEGAPSFISVFAGRIADAGVDPVPIMCRSLAIMRNTAPRADLIWASPREVLNVVQANAIGCDIITITSQLIPKLDTLGKDLDLFSLETVQMFHRDAVASGFEV